MDKSRIILIASVFSVCVVIFVTLLAIWLNSVWVKVEEIRTQQAEANRLQLEAYLEEMQSKAKEETLQRITEEEGEEAAKIYALNGFEGPLYEVLDTLQIKTDIKNAASLMNIDLNSNAKVEVNLMFSGRLIKVNLSTGIIVFDSETRELYEYTPILNEEVPRELTHDDAVDVEVARDNAQQLLTALKLENDLSDAWDELTDEWDRAENDLEYAVWEFSYFRPYEDYKTSGYTGVTVSAYSGKVKYLRYQSIIVPENMEIKLDEKEACEAVKRFAELKKLNIGNPAYLDKHLMHPNPNIWDHPLEEVPGIDYSKSRPTYRVIAKKKTENTLDDNDEDMFYSFYVDCYSGAIISGSGEKHKLRLRPETRERLGI